MSTQEIAAKLEQAGLNVYNTPFLAINGPGDKQPEMITSIVIPQVFAILAVCLRFAARLLTKTPLWVDDWLMLPAIVGSLMTAGVASWALTQGNGKYVGEVTFGKLRSVLTQVFVAEIVYSFIIAFVKVSILALYWRVFPKQWVRTFCLVTGAVVIGWLISNTVVVCTQCQPIEGFWDRTKEASCDVNIKAFLLGAAFINVATDVVMLALPIHLCLKLQQTRVNKLLLVGVFATGGLVTIISIIRLVAIFNMNISDPISQLNITWSFVEVSIWTEVEQNVAIVSACLPCLKPIVSRIFPSGFIPSLERKTPSPGQSGGSSGKRAGLCGSQNAWIKAGSWKNRNRGNRGHTFSELMDTENHDTDSQLPLSPLETKLDRADTSYSGKALGEIQYSVRSAGSDVERGIVDERNHSAASEVTMSPR